MSPAEPRQWTELERQMLDVLLHVYEAQLIARSVGMGLPPQGSTMRHVEHLIDTHAPHRKADIRLWLHAHTDVLERVAALDKKESP